MRRSAILVGTWRMTERLQAIVQALDPISAELGRVPTDAQEMMNKLFAQLADIQTLGTDTRLALDKLQEAHHEQAEKVASVERMITEIHRRLMMTVAAD
jgi:hypothetical protein